MKRFQYPVTKVKEVMVFDWSLKRVRHFMSNAPFFSVGSHWKNSSVEIGETFMILIPNYKNKI